MAAVSWGFPSLEKVYRCNQLQELARSIPSCSICLKRVSTPVESACGYIFDRHCLEQQLVFQPGKFPDISSFVERADIVERISCQVVAIFYVTSVNFSTISSIDTFKSTLFTPKEQIEAVAIARYVEASPNPDEKPAVERVTVNGGLEFFSATTLADHLILPDEEVRVQLFLAE